MSAIRKFKSLDCLLLSIPLTILIFTNGWPLLNNIIQSFSQKHSGVVSYNFQNYISVIKDTTFWITLTNSLIVLTYIPVTIIMGILLSVLIYNNFIGRKLFIYIIFFPQILPTVAIGKIFSSFFGLKGPMNGLISRLGYRGEDIYWLGNPKLSFIVIIVCITWLSFGWQTLIFNNALSAIDKNVKELVELDGVPFFRSIVQIYLPSLKNTIVYSVFINLLLGFSGIFPLIFILTNGGPGYQTSTLDYIVYLKAFGPEARIGESYALAIILLIIILLLLSGFYFFYYLLGKHNIED